MEENMMRLVYTLLKNGYHIAKAAAFLGRSLLRFLLKFELHEWLAFAMGLVAVLSFVWDTLRRGRKLKKVLKKLRRVGKKKKRSLFGMVLG